MPIVLCDTSPLQYLHQIGQLHLLPQLYGHVTVPFAVAQEIAVGISRGIDLPDLKTLPWLKVRVVRIPLTLPADTRLGAGELEVLTLAKDAPGSLTILDDRLGRHYARSIGLRNVVCRPALNLTTAPSRSRLRINTP